MYDRDRVNRVPAYIGGGLQDTAVSATRGRFLRAERGASGASGKSGGVYPARDYNAPLLYLAANLFACLFVHGRIIVECGFVNKS